MSESDIHRHIGQLQGEQVALAREIKEIKQEQKEQGEKIDLILEIVNKGQGGWRVLVGMGLVVTGVITLLINLRKLIGLGG